MDSSDFIEIIDELGKRLEGPAKHLFDLAVRQVYVDFFTAVLCFVVAITLALIVIPKATRIKKNLPPRKYLDGTDMLGQAPHWLFAGVGSGIAAVGTGIWVLAVFGTVLNPEWAAIAKIARTVLP